MEYEEPDDGLDDLIDGSDDEDIPREKTQSKLLDLDDLVVSSSSNKASSSSSRNIGQLAMNFDLELMDSDDSEAEDDHEKVDRDRDAKDAELAGKRERIIEMLSRSAPGLNLFPRSQQEHDNIDLKFFDLKSLSLEKHCDYKRRGKLLGHGFSNEKLNEMFSDRFVFMLINYYR